MLTRLPDHNEGCHDGCLHIADSIASPESGVTKTAIKLQVNPVQLQGFHPAFYTIETRWGFILW
jgi:hypothetical protein